MQRQKGTYNDISANYGFSYDVRDRTFNPSSGSLVSFNQILPIYADKSFIANTFSASTYKTISEDLIGVTKFYISAINGLGSDDVRLSKRTGLSSKDSEDLRKIE